MKQTILCGAVLLGLETLAGTFPYAQNMTTRYQAGATEVASFDSPVDIPAVAGGMQANEDVAVFESGIIDFCASDAENWATGVAAVGTAQASLSMKVVDSSCVWMGYVGGTGDSWVALTGPTAEEGEWLVKVEIDYTNGKSVRYSVKRPADASYTALTSGGASWLPLGGNATRISSVKLYGCGSVASLLGKCAARPIEGTVTSGESYSMNYGNLKVSAQVADVWGAEGVRVTLKDGNGKTLKTVDGTISGDAITADFSDVATPGASYTYDVVLTGRGQSVTSKSGASVDLFGNIDWFGFSNGAFVKSSAQNITAGASSFAANDAVVGTVTPSVASSENALTTVDSRLVIDGAYAWSALPADGTPQFALALARTDAGTRAWAYRIGSGAWTAIDSAFTTDNGTYDVRLVLGYAATPRTAACLIKLASASDYTTLVSGLALSAAKLNRVAVRSGDFAALAASYATTNAAPAAVDESKSEIALSANTELDLSTATQTKAYTVSKPAGKSYRLAWKDGQGAYATMEGGVLTVKKGAPQNGVDSFASHILGLDPENAQAKPFAAGEQNADSDKLTLSIPNVRQRSAAETGVDVTYRLVESTDASFSTKSTTATSVNETTFSADLPKNGSVKYYRIEIELAK